MARAASALIERGAHAWGAGIARYSRAALSFNPPAIFVEKSLPNTPVLLVGWHEANMLTLIAHAYLTQRSAIAFIPPGLGGIAMRGWLEELGIAPVALADDARRGLGLRQMRAALSEGKNVLIALDGPHGPRHKIAPGALWLARASGAEIRPVGGAALRYVTLPRWDRLIIPMPGTPTVFMVGSPWDCDSVQAMSEVAIGALASELRRLTALAQAALRARTALEHKEAIPWT